eukprot:10186520-Heterocapsa_arctica.AAC.1
MLPRTTSRTRAREPQTTREVPQVVGTDGRSLLRGEINLFSYRYVKAPFTRFCFPAQNRVGASASFNQDATEDLPTSTINSGSGRGSCFKRRRLPNTIAQGNT